MRCRSAILVILSALSANHVGAAEPAGRSVLLDVGYFLGLGDPTTVSVQGTGRTHASDDVTLGLGVEGPTLWKSLYPFLEVQWRFGDRYSTDDYYVGRIDAKGTILGAGLGYGFTAWQATLRLTGAVGYSWETLDVDYDPLGVEPLEIGNDGSAWLLGASLAFPFAARVNALGSYELVFRSSETIDGSYENGRTYHVETAGISGVVSIGLLIGLGSR